MLALPLAGFGPAHRAYAATIDVTTFSDNLINNGDCSLREAIQAANNDSAVDACPAGSGADTIVLSAGTYMLAIPSAAGANENATGDLSIMSELTIDGIDSNTVGIDGGNLDRVFSIQPGANVTLRGFAVSDGASDANGGAIHVDRATLILDGITLANNTAAGSGGALYNDHGIVELYGGMRDNTTGGNGGAIDNDGGTVRINSAQFNNNVAGDNGGAISNNATLIVEKVWIHDNTATTHSGGAIYNTGAATITDSFIHNSYAVENGGNIYSGDAALSSLTISNTTIWRGLAEVSGGGVYNNGALMLSNVTVAENRADSGGGLYNAENTQKPLGLVNTTILSNTNETATPGAGILNTGSPILLKNTLLAFNEPLGNCAGSINSAGHNLSSDSTCSLTSTGDLAGTDPLVGPLEDNGGVILPYGGHTPTNALLPGSPAINGGTNVGCPAVDQRGLTRPHGPACDIGAFETNDVPRTADDTYTIDEDTLLAVSAPGVLSNDADPDNDVITTTLLTTPAHGTLTLSQSGALSYMPDPNYHGQDSFSYQVDDGDLISASATVTLTVNSVNDPPIAANDSASTRVDTNLSIPTAVLLSNDTDIEGDILTISGVHSSSARGGQVVLAGTQVVYTPPVHFRGVDSLIYTLSDGNGGTANATVTIMVEARTLYLPIALR
jgi:CSLREA domain-containing protein